MDSATGSSARPGVLVVWYSQGGRTAQVGEELSRLLGAERDLIRETLPRQGLSGRWRSRWEALRRRPAPIRPMGSNPADYRLVIVGTPVWHRAPAAPVRRYLLDHAGSFRQLAFFGLAGSPGAADEAFDEMQRLCGQAPVARLWCRLGTYGGGDPIEGVRGFMDSVLPLASAVAR